MNEVCYDVVCDSLQRGYQVMVFVHSRKGTGETARALAEIASKRNELDRYFITMGSEENGEAHTKYADRVEKSKNKEVREHFGNGCGIHHAGMLRNDRKLTEQMFADGAIKVLCCTATLAWGKLRNDSLIFTFTNSDLQYAFTLTCNYFSFRYQSPRPYCRCEGYRRL